MFRDQQRYNIQYNGKPLGIHLFAPATISYKNIQLIASEKLRKYCVLWKRPEAAVIDPAANLILSILMEHLAE